jgi:D-alanyl-D-alanine carboxypeptidase/D-alanyl-D-alanine-endopeptidase (penicillin-binding protein 4)
VRVSVIPESFVSLTGSVVTGGGGSTENVRLSLRPKGETLGATLRGRLPETSPTMVIERRVEDPRLLAGYALRDVLDQVGIVVEGAISLGERKGRLLSAHRSVPLARLLYRMGKHSDNFYAEMIFKSISIEPRAGAEPASFARSSTKVRKLLADAGIDVSPLRFDNGSGLFDANRVTPDALVSLLRRASGDPRVGPELISQLSIAGTDGTLRARMRSLRGTGAVRAKTGTLAAVSALTGYVFGKRRLAVSVMLNDVRGRAILLRADIDRFVTAVAGFAGVE